MPTTEGARPHLVTHLESASSPPSDERDVLLFFDGVSRAGVGCYDHEAGRWLVAVAPAAGATARWVDAWAELPTRWEVQP